MPEYEILLNRGDKTIKITAQDVSLETVESVDALVAHYSFTSTDPENELFTVACVPFQNVVYIKS
jgi:hypothetical protein